MNQNNVSRVLTDFFYEHPQWFRTFRSGSANTTLPWKIDSKYLGLSIDRSSVESQNNYQPLNGSRIIIHNTDEFPFMAGRHLFHKTFELVNIYFTPALTITDNVLSSWKPEKRNCFMRHEKALKYFKIYTRINCAHECLAEATLRTCGCVPFYMISELILFTNS